MLSKFCVYSCTTDDSRAKLADSLKAYEKHGVFNFSCRSCEILYQLFTLKVRMHWVRKVRMHLQVAQGATCKCIAWKHAWWLCWCMIFTIINLAEKRYVCEWGRDGVMFMCARVYHVVLCGYTLRNVSLGLWQVGQPWCRVYQNSIGLKLLRSVEFFTCSFLRLCAVGKSNLGVVWHFVEKSLHPTCKLINFLFNLVEALSSEQICSNKARVFFIVSFAKSGVTCTW